MKSAHPVREQRKFFNFFLSYETGAVFAAGIGEKNVEHTSVVGNI